MTIGDIASAQVEDPIIDTGGKNISVEASIDKAFTVKPTFKDAIQEASVPPSSPESTHVTVIEMGSGSAPAATVITTMDILKELTLKMIKNFFATMTFCSKLVL